MENKSEFYGLKKFILDIASDDVVSNMKFVYGETQYIEKVIAHYKKKAILTFGVIFAALFVLIIQKNAVSNNNQLINGQKIARNDINGGMKKVELIAISNDIRYSNDISFDVSERRYSYNEIEQLALDIKGEFPAIVLSGNDTADCVMNDLILANHFENYPFSISYSIDNSELINQNGEINRENLRLIDDGKGVLTEITVHLSYYDFKEDFCVYIMLFSQEQPFEEKLNEAIISKIKYNDKKYVTSDYIPLPNEICGINITYREQPKRIIWLMIFALTVMIIIIYKGLDTDLSKQKETIAGEMMREYPNLVMKFALYHNAGMSVRNIWNNICSEYIKERNTTHRCKEIYERMILCNISISEGQSEMEAYMCFADELSLKKYRFFMSLLCQMITKGNGNVSTILINESMEAFEQKKNNTRKIAEEASTKLILPMILMLLVVIVMVVYPAFSSFKY